MFLGQDRTAGGHAADERQTQLFTQNVFQLNAARSAGDQIDHAFALQGAQVLLGGMRRLEAERARYFRTRRRHAAFGNSALNEPEDLSLAGGKVRHASPVYVDSDCHYIQSSSAGKSAYLHQRYGVSGTGALTSGPTHAEKLIAGARAPRQLQVLLQLPISPKVTQHFHRPCHPRNRCAPGSAKIGTAARSSSTVMRSQRHCLKGLLSVVKFTSNLHIPNHDLICKKRTTGKYGLGNRQIVIFSCNRGANLASCRTVLRRRQARRRGWT